MSTSNFLEPVETELPKIEAGDYQDIDEYMSILEEYGIDADYENIHNDYGFIAELKINGVKHAVFESTPTGHMVKSVEKPVKEILKTGEPKELFKICHDSVKASCCNWDVMETYWNAENREIALIEINRNTPEDRTPHGICGNCMTEMLTENKTLLVDSSEVKA